MVLIMGYDIFNRKRVEELERELKGIENENERLRRGLSNAESHISQLLTLRDNVPEDCNPGSYCAACEFGRLYTAYIYVGGYMSDRCHDYRRDGYICDKANSCKNFIQKEIKND